MLLQQMAPAHLAKVHAAQQTGRREVGTIYRRTRKDEHGNKVLRAELRMDGLAGCLRTPAAGLSRQIVLTIEGEEVRSRLMSPREAARLMGVSNDYVLPSNFNQALHLVGDGVAVPVVSYLAEHVLDPILQQWTHARGPLTLTPCFA